MDGKQARRTNSSTPLGELFDHGLDSWSCVYFVVTVYSIFGRGSSGVSVFVLYLLLWVVLFSFILSHWEKYNTGILFLPWGYDVSQVVSMCSSLICNMVMNFGETFCCSFFIDLMLFWLELMGALNFFLFSFILFLRYLWAILNRYKSRENIVNPYVPIT